MSHGRAEDLLFNKADTYSVFEGQKRAMAKAVEELPAKRVLDDADQALAGELAKKFTIDVPQLREDGITVSPPREVDVDVSRDFRRAVYGHGPHHVKGISVTFSVPFIGDQEMFFVRPNSFDTAPPRGQVGQTFLEVTYSGVDLNAEDLKRQFADFLASTKKYLGWHSESVTPFNNSLHRLAADYLAARKARLSHSEQLVGSLGYEVK